MRRAIAAGLLALAAAGCVPSAAELNGPTIPTDLVPDPDYRAGAGDRAILYAVDKGAPLENIPLLMDITAHDRYERLRASGTSADLAELEERKELLWTPAGTRVVVLNIVDRSHTGSRLAAEVRMIDGPHKDRTLWTAREHLARFKAREPE